MKGLTEKQKRIVEFISEFMEENEMAPTIYEIAEHFKIKTSTVFAHIRALQKKACLTRSSKARSISLNRSKRKNRFPAGLQCVPILESVESHKKERDLFCDAALFLDGVDELKKEDLFALKVKSRNFDRIGILEGDIVIVKGNPQTLRAGDIVLMEYHGKNILSPCRFADDSRVEMDLGTEDPLSAKTGDLPMKGIVVGLQRRISK